MIRVQGDDFEPGAEIDRLLDGHTAVGGVASFIGVVRDDPESGPALRAMTLEHYPGMTERMLAAIEQEANQRWDLCASLIVHRYGRMVPGDRIVLVVTAARHRQAALESCQFLIDWLKTKAPFWKREETEDGERWVQAQARDDVAAAKWQIEPSVS